MCRSTGSWLWRAMEGKGLRLRSSRPEDTSEALLRSSSAENTPRTNTACPTCASRAASSAASTPCSATLANTRCVSFHAALSRHNSPQIARTPATCTSTLAAFVCISCAMLPKCRRLAAVSIRPSAALVGSAPGFGWSTPLPPTTLDPVLANSGPCAPSVAAKCPPSGCGRPPCIGTGPSSVRRLFARTLSSPSLSVLKHALSLPRRSEAIISGVSPLGSAWSGSAPAFSSAATMLSESVRHACRTTRSSGVRRCLVWSLGLAPCLSRSSTIGAALVDRSAQA
mmetsp:Transcript_97690/g.146426  ORF Transcript_97690/g.146426 Transcript_97690/m.146426 type:complete len:283 (+) Transcript_97690:1061-1909(+)